ncbi:hypothetical protein DDE82_005721 [Stemphylium lycopersici]|uniref:Uncharacterized protein n=1 Tax=Stemphylium lycopersici TaxID=183478 RepID=A0A364N7E4_STELY|nr:hypothetical protein DDE82_005721 [Stemphylium lycopersici]RAR13157.1 hypothetical protein DDE83_003542 [Stemphylium lycopersici]
MSSPTPNNDKITHIAGHQPTFHLEAQDSGVGGTVQQTCDREFVAALSGYGRLYEKDIDVDGQGELVGSGVQILQQQVVGQLFAPVWVEAEWGSLGGGYAGNGKGFYIVPAGADVGRDDGRTHGSTPLRHHGGYTRNGTHPQVQANWHSPARAVLGSTGRGMDITPDTSDRQQLHPDTMATKQAHRRWSPYQNAVSIQTGHNVHAASNFRGQHQIKHTHQATPPQPREDEKLGEPTASLKAGIPFFTSFAQAKACIPAKDWRCPASDATLPSTPRARQDYVNQLLSALNNTQNTLDTSGLTFTKRWSSTGTGTSTTSPSPNHPPYYNPHSKESLCWLILSLAERLHTSGPSTAFTSLDTAFWADAKRTREWSFRERIVRIAELLASSKSKCDALLGGGGLQLLVANPEERLRAAVADGRGNGKKRELLGGVAGVGKGMGEREDVKMEG